MSIVQHSSRSDMWFTPPKVIEMSRNVLGGTIHLDPASCERANKVVLANRFMDEKENGLNTDWGKYPGSVFLNPPGGKQGNKSIAIEFWKKLMFYREFGTVSHAIFMSFSVEHLQTSQGKGVRSMLDTEFCVCIPKTRIKFLLNGELSKVAPSHSNAIIYVPGTTNNSSVFKEIFTEIGDCK